MNLADEYLTSAEVAGRLRWSVRTLRAKIAAGALREGLHFFRPQGCQPRWKWAAVVEWLEGQQAPVVEGERLRLAHGGGRRLLG